MENIWYTATERFDPSIGEEWNRYIAWANLPQLKECVSLDGTHRAGELAHLIDADWEHNVHRDYCTTYFWDLDYLLKRFERVRQAVNILAISFDPPFEVRELGIDPRFNFQGYDLIDQYQISAISNCIGFDDAFRRSDVSPVGLFDTYAFARQAQKLLHERYPDEHHAQCDVWAIWKMTSE